MEKLFILYNFATLGEKGIEFDQVDRPVSASSSVGSSSSRPSTANSLKSHATPDPVGGQEPIPESDIAEEEEEDATISGTDPVGDGDTSGPEPIKDPYKIDSTPPDQETKLEDVVDELPDHVLSRAGTPSQWVFDEKDTSLKTTPPRPTSATLCSPPVPRKVPISVDHHLRK